jgi:hypothetical protein
VKRTWKWLSRSLFPAAGSPHWRRIAPYGVLCGLVIVILASASYTWEYTDSSDFCGTTCHTMPPEYSAYQQSSHVQVKCVECHVGNEFNQSQFSRKGRILRHATALLFERYETPIQTKDLRPTREVCQTCHPPDELPSDVNQRAIVQFAPDVENTQSRTYLLLKTGGGPAGHWHIDNQVFFYASDDRAQQIPYVRAVVEIGGPIEFVDINADFDPYALDESKLQEMDCVTCHNRVSHTIDRPEESVDRTLLGGIISPRIPEIRRKAVEVLRAGYDGTDQAIRGIADLADFYRANYPEVYDLYSAEILQAIDALQEIYIQSVFPELKVDWDTYPNNMGHRTGLGCFRCHDGQHIDNVGQAIRLECNLCHAIPVVAGPSDEVPQVERSQSPQPRSHQNPNWIALHRLAFDENDEAEFCKSCHDTSNYEAADDSSFCANSACHGNTLTYLSLEALDRPDVREMLLQQLPHYPRSLPPVSAWGDSPSLETTHQVQLGLGCKVCHDPFPPLEPPSNEVCMACHGGTLSGWQELTAGFEPNPHNGHYGELSCATCHKNFGPYRSPCSLCHENVAIVPLENSEGR